MFSVNDLPTFLTRQSPPSSPSLSPLEQHVYSYMLVPRLSWTLPVSRASPRLHEHDSEELPAQQSVPYALPSVLVQ